MRLAPLTTKDCGTYWDTFMLFERHPQVFMDLPGATFDGMVIGVSLVIEFPALMVAGIWVLACRLIARRR